jgi:hypothetical protein
MHSEAKAREQAGEWPVHVVGEELHPHILLSEFLFVLFHEGDEWHAWGLVSTVLYVYHDGKVSKGMCNRTTSSVPSHAKLYDNGIIQVSHLPTINLDQAWTLLSDRLRCKVQEDAGLESTAYVLLLHAASINPDATHEFMRIQEKIDMRGIVHDPLFWLHQAFPNAAMVNNKIQLPFECGIQLLNREVAMRYDCFLHKGTVTAPLCSWIRPILARLREIHIRNIEFASKCESDPRLVHMLLAANTVMSNKRVKREPHRDLVAAGNMAALEEAMPKCMQNLHERATINSKRHLLYKERQHYYSFMLLNGVRPDELATIQEDCTKTRLGNTEGSRYLRDTIGRQAQSLDAWLTSKASRGSGCKTMYADGSCGYSSEPTVGRAQWRCQQHRASMLHRPDTDRPTGTPVGFTQEMLASLNAKVQQADDFDRAMALMSTDKKLNSRKRCASELL